MGTDLERFSVSQVTTRDLALDEAAGIYARAGLRRIGLWHDKVDEIGIAQARRRLGECGLEVSSLSWIGGFTHKGEEGVAETIAESRRRIDMAAELGAPCITVAPGGLLPGSRDVALSRRIGFDALAELLPYARAAGVRLGVEPHHPMYAVDWALLNTMRDANDLCDRLGDDLGIVLDVYHVWWDPELEREIARAGAKARICLCHIDDWLAQTQDIWADRGMMGEGVIDLARIRGWLEAAGFDGTYEVELISRRWWKRDPLETVETCRVRFEAMM